MEFGPLDELPGGIPAVRNAAGEAAGTTTTNARNRLVPGRLRVGLGAAGLAAALTFAVGATPAYAQYVKLGFGSHTAGKHDNHGYNPCPSGSPSQSPSATPSESPSESPSAIAVGFAVGVLPAGGCPESGV